jgi:hypothetical protein
MALIGGPTVGAALDDPQNDIARLTKELTDDKQLTNELFLRIFNRPATAAELQAAVGAMNEIESGHQQVTQMLADREAWWKEEEPKLEAARKTAMTNATAELAAYEKEIAPRRAEEEKIRAAKQAAAQEDFDKYNADLATHTAEYLAKSDLHAEWFLLEPDTVAGPNGITLERMSDRSIKATGKADQGAYTITVKTSLTDISAFRIEALQDTSIEGNGPGLPANGNFVVTEFEVHAATAAKPTEFEKVALANARADFLQSGFDVGLAIDGNPGNQNAWAVANSGGVTHWATFETKAPLGHDGGTILKFVVHQNHTAKQHLLGRFRISVTQNRKPGLSLPESLKAIAGVPAENRTESQQATAVAWFSKSDAALTAKTAALNEAKKPLPEDPGVTEHKEKLAIVSQDVVEDAKVVRLRSDVEYSTKQVTVKRLTAAQDLAWALINSPAFLFNH